jgi:hypothetical protein
MLLLLLNAREKVFRPQGILFFGKDPVASLPPSCGLEVTGFCIFDSKFGVRRQSAAATALSVFSRAV